MELSSYVKSINNVNWLYRLGLLLVLFNACACSSTNSDSANEVISDVSTKAPACFDNPVISGFHPDPSFIRSGDDYYLVNSSFEWFPGIPIFKSKDLVNWQQIGHVLDRPSQLNMVKNRASSGIWAPTIRYHDGLYYVVVTCKQCRNDCNCGNNFFVTAESPEGPWSDPIWVKGSKGIDPAIFWDDDGVAYYVGSTNKLGGKRRWPSEDRIYIQRLDTKTGDLLGEPTVVLSGHAHNAKFAEGPRLYKRNGKYVIMIAEGGTWANHAITTFESDKLLGPYVAQQINPVLTHRHLGKDATITTLGHADFVQTPKGDWWSVMLGVRPQKDGHYYLGRETFLSSMEWQGTTPIFNPGKGRIYSRDTRPDLPWTPLDEDYKSLLTFDDFVDEKLAVYWSFLRTPQTQFYQLSDGQLLLTAKPVKLTEQDNPSLIARRLQHLNTAIGTKLTLSHKSKVNAGLTLYQNDRFHYRFEKSANDLKLIKVFNTKRNVLTEHVVKRISHTNNTLVLSADISPEGIQFLYGDDQNSLTEFAELQDILPISTKASGGFIGAFAGMYAVKEQNSPNEEKVAFDWFSYRPSMDNAIESHDIARQCLSPDSE